MGQALWRRSSLIFLVERERDREGERERERDVDVVAEIEGKKDPQFLSLSFLTIFHTAVLNEKNRVFFFFLSLSLSLEAGAVRREKGEEASGGRW